MCVSEKNTADTFSFEKVPKDKSCSLKMNGKSDGWDKKVMVRKVGG
jgi:hypothetical protein